MSKPAEIELSDIQAWLHTFVVEPGSNKEALQAAESKAGFQPGSAEALILPSPTLAPQERIQIYRGMYLMRMEEALEIDFPAIAERLGSKVFRELVASYVRTYPSQSYTLDHLGRKFAQYLSEIDYNKEGEFLKEFAELEWSLCVVAIAEDTPTLAMTDLADLNPDDFVHIRLTPAKSIQTWTFEHNVNESYKAWMKDLKPPTVRKETNRVVVWRSDLQVWRMDLSESALHFLEQLLQGVCLGQALDNTIEKFDESEEQLFAWFQNWVKEEFFSHYELS